jgi:hypothetical protein
MSHISADNPPVLVSPALRVFGIRHHGPGSARRLLEALKHWQPDAVVIEFPTDAEAILRQGGQAALEPPVAVVLYDEKYLSRASYYPFASFSPEWRALQWATENQAAVYAMDLPASHQLALRYAPQLQLTTSASVPNPIWDPLGTVAQLAGFADAELWWESTFEQETDDLALFTNLSELMADLRAATALQRETLIREAYMRKVLRKVLKTKLRRIAVVCGAWHAPALTGLADYKATADNKLLRGLPKLKIKSAWIPWSYPRLVKEGGYGAGVHSPAWYELRYDYGTTATVHWMVKASQLLRAEGIDSSPAHAQEAVQLARTLAQLKNRSLPALSELEDAALSTLCAGSTERLELIHTTLVQGTKVGLVPESASQVPIQKDLMAELRSSRLSKYWGQVGEQWLKATKSNPQGGIDLRQPTDRHKSQLLNRLLILGISWGNLWEVPGNDLGAFKERWRLQWQPEFSLRLVEAAMWGNTVVEAAGQRLQQFADEVSLLQLAQNVLLGLRADLPQAIPPVLTRLAAQAALTKDVAALLASLPTLIQIIQYGDARKTDVTSMALLIEELTPRLAAGLPTALTQIDTEVAQGLFLDFLATHRALCQLDLPLLDRHWRPLLHKLSELPGIAPLFQGLATRLLFDQEELPLATVETRMSYALSKAGPPLTVANWLTGFLHGSGLVLLHHSKLWAAVDNWIDRLTMDELTPVLPQLRRTFAAFSPGERERILARVQRSQTAALDLNTATATADTAYDKERAAVLRAGLAQWLKQ